MKVVVVLAAYNDATGFLARSFANKPAPVARHSGIDDRKNPTYVVNFG